MNYSLFCWLNLITIDFKFCWVQISSRRPDCPFFDRNPPTALSTSYAEFKRTIIWRLNIMAITANRRAHSRLPTNACSNYCKSASFFFFFETTIMNERRQKIKTELFTCDSCLTEKHSSFYQRFFSIQQFHLVVITFPSTAFLQNPEQKPICSDSSCYAATSECLLALTSRQSNHQASKLYRLQPRKYLLHQW